MPKAEAVHMVDRQLRDRGIKSESVLEAMLLVPRDNFVPPASQDRAYADCALPTMNGQTISQPYMVAVMTQFLDLKPGMEVLEIGTGSGYQTAVLQQLGGIVHSVERDAELSAFANANLQRGGSDKGVCLHVGDGSLGLVAHAPYDRILVTAAAPYLPDALKQQLKNHGRIVVPVGSERTFQRLMAYELQDGEWREESDLGCVFVPLIGADAW